MTDARPVVIRAEGLSKKYELGRMGSARSIRELFSRRGTAQPADARSEFWALQDVSFDLRQGEVLGIVGRNGAGKSTLLKILARITEPTTGRVELHGRLGSLLEVGTGFHPELSGRENIFLNGAILGMSRREIRSKLDEIVSFSEIERFIDTAVKHYSSGMYMRLAFSVAAHLDTELLLVDEVLAVGDVGFQRRCLGRLGDVARSGRTILFVTHNMNAVQQLCDRVLLLESGRVAALSADVMELTRRYLFSTVGVAPTEWRSRDSAEFRNDYFTPHRLALVDAAGNTLSGAVSRKDVVHVLVEGEVGVADPCLELGVAVYAEDGELLYWSCATDREPEMWPQLEPGRCRLSTALPLTWLNEGTYRLELIAALHFREWLLAPGAGGPAVTLTVQGGLSQSPYWLHRRPGLLAPVLKWTADV